MLMRKWVLLSDIPCYLFMGVMYLLQVNLQQ